MVYRTADVLPRRLHPRRADVEALAPDDRAYRRSLSDEVAIDFPSARAAADSARRMAMGGDAAPSIAAEIRVDRIEAVRGATVSVSLPMRHTCDACGGRGEIWDDPCVSCLGDGHTSMPLVVDLRVPPGTSDGDRIRFVITPRRGPRTRVDVRVAVSARP